MGNKVLFCIDSPAVGGSEINAFKVIDFIRDLYEVTMMIDPNASKLREFATSRNIEVVTYFSPNDARNLVSGSIKALKKTLKYKNHLFVVWSHHINSNRWLQFILSLTRKNFIVVEQLLPTDYNVHRKASKLTIPLKKIISKRALCTVICAYSQLDNYKTNLKSQRLSIIPNSRDIEGILSRVKLLQTSRVNTEGKLVISCVARLAHQKDQKTLLRAISLLSQTSVELLLVGDGEDRDFLEGYIKSLKLSNVRITGFVHDIVPYLAISDIFVLPSLDEGLPGALIEAMAAGVPCIASDIPGNNELVLHNQTGLLFKTGDADSLAEKIRQYINEPKYRARLAEEAYHHVGKYYDDKFAKEKWLCLMEKCFSKS